MEERVNSGVIKALPLPGTGTKVHRRFRAKLLGIIVRLFPYSAAWKSLQLL